MIEEALKDYSIFKTNLLKDRSKIVKFWQDNFRGWPEAKFDLFYSDNPFGESICWLLKHDGDNRIVGATAVFPKRIMINGKPKMVGIAGDLGIEKAYRGHGQAKLLQKTLVSGYKEAGMEFLYGTPNVVSERVCLKAGYKIVGRTVRMVKILRSFPYLKRALKIDFLAKLVSWPVDLVLKIKSKDQDFENKGRYGYELPERFDERFDRLWEKAAGQYAIIGERTSRALNWRFSDCPYKSYHIFALTDGKSGEILGYIVYQIIKRNVQIADFFSIHLGKNIDAMFSEFIKYFRKKDIDTVTFYYFGNQDVIEKASDYDFMVRPDNRSIIVEISEGYPEYDIVLDKENWHYLDGDNDGDA